MDALMTLVMQINSTEEKDIQFMELIFSLKSD